VISKGKKNPMNEHLQVNMGRMIIKIEELTRHLEEEIRDHKIWKNRMEEKIIQMEGSIKSIKILVQIIGDILRDIQKKKSTNDAP
jgi:hypothetical protein